MMIYIAGAILNHAQLKNEKTKNTKAQLQIKRPLENLEAFLYYLP